ncbi:glycosyltransferase family 2 protein [Sporosarcina sp. Sa2YVA2]|uniref:Glycosyltransferase family 2 protein n=1 Tax=Sporosarcina quadrami TaxID=2762234 RepID=A0ABR8U8Y1_9BACL|nr:glycosyltransferase [Sporosarcina quadrami]MBD7984497.1 glycosyltransferase family 2 protein [Sporosarcina quadrami]
MLVTITLVFFCLFIVFQVLYIFVPLYSSRKKEKTYPSVEKGISVLIPAYNENLVIENCISGLFQVSYGHMEIIFINDGSTDLTLKTLQKLLLLNITEKVKTDTLSHEKVRKVYRSAIYPNIYVLDKANGGKADALNAGICYASHDIIITLDADSVLDSQSLTEINRTFEDDTIVAAGGLVHVLQGYHHNGNSFNPSFHASNLIRFQVVRYLTGFYMNKTTQSTLNAMTVIAGAFGAFRKDVLFQAGGYRKTVGEDMDITLRIQELIGTILKGKRIAFIPEAICYTECPASLKSLYNQRIRWQKAFIDCIITFRKSLFRKMNFRVSLFLLFDSLILGTLSAYPVLFIPLILLFTPNHLKLFLLLFSISFSIAILLHIATLLVSRRFAHHYRFREYLTIISFLPLEVLLYRLTEVVFVTFGTILYFFNKDEWSRSDRIGKPILLNRHMTIDLNDKREVKS